MARVDARLREMQFLARLNQDGPTEITGVYDGSPERQMIVSLVNDGYLNGIDSRADSSSAPWSARYDDERYTDIWRLLHTQSHIATVTIQISHKGRVRLSELEQQLRTGRDRDETGLLWTKRHLLTDLAIVILSADKDRPLSVAFLDMNGLKTINDTHGHAAGDEAIRVFFQAVVSTLGQNGEASRNGGDEVVVVLPEASDEKTHRLLHGFVRQLGKEELHWDKVTTAMRLTASGGTASTTTQSEDANTLLKRADDVQYRAKEKSRERTPRMSTIAVKDGEVVLYDPAQEGAET